MPEGTGEPRHLIPVLGEMRAGGGWSAGGLRFFELPSTKVEQPNEAQACELAPVQVAITTATYSPT
jgi:hypothetical protein